jgi:hypothetical protein
MGDEDSLTEHFEDLLSTFEHVLSVDRIRQLQIVIDYDEHKLAFEMLSAMLREVGAVVPEEARASFLHLAHQLRIDAALWRDICNPVALSH